MKMSWIPKFSPIRVGVRDTCMNYPDVEFTVIKILFYEILIMLGIKFITKTDFFYQGRIYNKTNPKHFACNPFSRIFDTYSELQLNQAVPRISLIKIYHSQVNISIILVTFVAIQMKRWDIATSYQGGRGFVSFVGTMKCKSLRTESTCIQGFEDLRRCIV